MVGAEHVCRLSTLIMTSLENNVRCYPGQWFIVGRVRDNQAEVLSRERPMSSKVCAPSAA